MNIIKVPDSESEDKRRINRERERLIKERGSHSARIKSLLCLHGVSADNVGKLKGRVRQLKTAVLNEALPADLAAEIERESDRYETVDKQIREIEKSQRKRVAEASDKAAQEINQLMRLRNCPEMTSLFCCRLFLAYTRHRERGVVITDIQNCRYFISA